MIPNHKKKPFDDVRVRRALTLAIDRWDGAPALSKIAIVHTVGGIVFPGSPLAATKEELQQIAGFWPDIEKSRAEAKRLLKEAGAEGLSFELLNRNVDQPYKYVGTWLIDQWSKIGLHVTQKVVPTGPWFDAMRSGNFEVVLEANCHGVVNPVLDVQTYLPSSVYSRELRLLRGPAGGRSLRQDAARDRSGEAARGDARVREIRASTPRRTRSGSCGGTGSCPTGPMSKAGRSARATSSTRIWRRSGSINDGRENAISSLVIPAQAGTQGYGTRSGPGPSLSRGRRMTIRDDVRRRRHWPRSWAWRQSRRPRPRTRKRRNAAAF